MDLRLTGRRLACITVTGMLQQMGVEAKSRATEEDRENTTTCVSGTYGKKNLYRGWEGHAHPHPSLS